MTSSVSAIIWKELKSAKHRIKQIIVNSCSIFVFITIVAVARLLGIKKLQSVLPIQWESIW